MIVIVVKNPVRSKYTEEWLDLVGPFTEATRSEPGNVSFEWFRDPNDPNLWVLVEVFQDPAAGEAHVSSEHFQAAMTEMPKWLAGVPEIIHIEGTSEGWGKMGEMS